MAKAAKISNQCIEARRHVQTPHLHQHSIHIASRHFLQNATIIVAAARSNFSVHFASITVGDTSTLYRALAGECHSCPLPIEPRVRFAESPTGREEGIARLPAIT